MKKNKMMRLASSLLVAVLLTSSVISGTFAKYTTSADANDKARVAKWGIELNVNSEEAFGAKYNDSISASGTQVIAFNDTDKIIAPGTNGELGEVKINGTTEVAVEVTRTAELNLANWTVNSEYYCPVLITVTVGSTPTEFSGLDYTSMANFEAAVEAALNTTTTEKYGPNESLADSNVTVLWSWAFENGTGVLEPAKVQDNAKDTLLGKAAQEGTSVPTIEFVITTQVDQVD